MDKANLTWGEFVDGKRENGTPLTAQEIARVKSRDPGINKLQWMVAQRKLQTGAAEPEEGFMQTHAEIGDRYGRIPRSVDNLFAYGRLRKLAERMAIVSIDRTPEGVAKSEKAEPRSGDAPTRRAS